MINFHLSFFFEPHSLSLLCSHTHTTTIKRWRKSSNELIQLNLLNFGSIRRITKCPCIHNFVWWKQITMIYKLTRTRTRTQIVFNELSFAPSFSFTSAMMFVIYLYCTIHTNTLSIKVIAVFHTFTTVPFHISLYTGIKLYYLFDK